MSAIHRCSIRTVLPDAWILDLCSASRPCSASLHRSEVHSDRLFRRHTEPGNQTCRGFFCFSQLVLQTFAHILSICCHRFSEAACYILQTARKQVRYSFLQIQRTQIWQRQDFLCALSYLAFASSGEMTAVSSSLMALWPCGIPSFLSFLFLSILLLSFQTARFYLDSFFPSRFYRAFSKHPDATGCER